MAAKKDTGTDVRAMDVTVEENGPEGVEAPLDRESIAADRDEGAANFDESLSKPDRLDEEKDEHPAAARETAEPAARASRFRQHPALVGEPGIEVAERSQDVEKASTTEHLKTFVALKRDLDTEDMASVHGRNMTAVRQYMVNQGIRPDGKVTFAGQRDHEDGVSVYLNYSVEAVPAVTADTLETRHTVIPSDGPTTAERAEHDAQRVDRIRASRDALRA